jgi:hypothetical protein
MKSFRSFAIWFRNKILLTIITFLITLPLLAQTEEHNSENQKKGVAILENRHFISFALSGTWIREGADEDNLNEKGHFVPGIGLDYFYRLHPKWEIGVMFDLELATYVIPRKDDLIRDRAILIVPTGVYSFSSRWNAFVGLGVELEQHQNLFIFRLGAEYSIPLKKGWIIPLGVFFDWKEGYDAFSFNIGIGKEF